MATIATSSPDEPDDEDSERQELRRLLSECMEWAPTGSLPSEAAFGIMYWLHEPIEDSDRKRRHNLLVEELKASEKPIGLRWFLQLLLRSVPQRYTALRESRRRDRLSIDTQLSDEERARIREALSDIANLRWQAAKFDLLRYVGGVSLDDIAKLMSKDMDAAQRLVDFQIAWLRYQLDRVSKESGDSDLAERPAEDWNTRRGRLERLFRENYDDMLRIVDDLYDRSEAMPSQHGRLSSEELLHEVFLRVLGDPRLDLEDRKAFFGLFGRIAAQTIVDLQRRIRQRDGKHGAPLRAGGMSRQTAPHSEGGILRRARRGVVRIFRSLFRRG
ncbi:MAG: sigma factor [Planctomycetota bacterium]|jgi:hypothetical protein